MLMWFVTDMHTLKVQNYSICNFSLDKLAVAHFDYMNWKYQNDQFWYIMDHLSLYLSLL